ncbi:MAG: hypothetical protein LBQ14_09565 [Treponema sp.]|jgi:hypothetical protein|nr:hypothetical protein [Treponema sp.]
MDYFDVSAKWVILAPFPAPVAAEDLARRIAALRKRDGLGEDIPAVLDAAGPAPGDSTPIIVLNPENSSDERGGYTWRAGRDRVEIYGDSRRGLCNGVYSFLEALGFRWPGPGQELPPPGPAEAGRAGGIAGGIGSTTGLRAGAGIYPLKVPGVYVRSNPSPENRRRLVIPPGVPHRELPALCQWAARNRVDVLLFSLRDKRLGKAPGIRAAAEAGKNWNLIVERGGWDLGFLVPRRYFFFKRDIFRMEEGKRKADHHFCPTSPDAIKLVQQRVRGLLDQQELWRGVGQGKSRDARDTEPEARRIYHLWPDRGAEHLWCACPACRAFSIREQNRLAVNAAAVVIAEKDPRAFISCREEEENPAEQLPGGSEITLKPNVFILKTGSPPDGGEPEGAPALYIYEHGAVREL